MAEKRIIANNGSSIVLYTTDDGNTQLEVKFGGSKWFDDSFNSSIGQIYQTFGGEDLYSSVEKKAAMLFLWFMEKNEWYLWLERP